ncbi:MAG: alpha/beta fold hydrolase [Gallionella sp.]|nr:alpha/beta fold hydrolase [Gallionella sp.]
MTSVLILPGYGDSDSTHWQSLWQLEHPEYHRVQQDSWDSPVMDDWLCRLDEAVSVAASPPVLVAHSLACLVVARWAAQTKKQVQGALLVAPPDPTTSAFPSSATGFATVANSRFNFPSIVIASSDDPYGTMEFQKWCAEEWGSRFIVAGARGHLNGESGLGTWPAGQTYLRELLRL